MVALAPINPNQPLSVTGRALADPPRKRRLTTTAEASMRRFLLDDSSGYPNWPTEVVEALNACTRKQGRYAICRALGIPIVSAYRQCYDVAAGRTDEIISSEAMSIEVNPRISMAVNALSLWLENRWLKDSLQVRDYILDRAYEESISAPEPKDRLAATKLLAQVTGQLVSRSEVIHRDGRDVDRQDSLAQAMLACISDALGQQSQQISELPSDVCAPQLASGATLCARCKAEIEQPAQVVEVLEVAPHPTATP